MKLVSFNVRVWTRDTNRFSPYYWKRRMKMIREFLLREDPDVICLQELSFPASLYIPWKYRRLGISASHHTYVRRGIGGHALWFSIHHNGAVVNGVRIINVHGTWKSCMQKVWMTLKRRISGKTIIVGDFNQTRSDVAQNPFRPVGNSDYTATFRNYMHGNEYDPDHCVVCGVDAHVHIYDDDFRMSDHLPLIVEY